MNDTQAAALCIQVSTVRSNGRSNDSIPSPPICFPSIPSPSTLPLFLFPPLPVPSLNPDGRGLVSAVSAAVVAKCYGALCDKKQHI